MTTAKTKETTAKTKETTAKTKETTATKPRKPITVKKVATSEIATFSTTADSADTQIALETASAALARIASSNNDHPVARGMKIFYAKASVAKRLESACKEVAECFDSFGTTSDALHNQMVSMFEIMAKMGKKEIKGNSALQSLFERRIIGIDRPRLVAWVHEFFPVRLLFKANGHFDQIGWSGSHAKNKGWLVTEARLESWYSFEAPKPTKKSKPANLEKGLDALVIQLARRAHELGSAKKAREELEALLTGKLIEKLGKAMESDALSNWAAGLTD